MYAISNNKSYERLIQFHFQGFSMYPFLRPGDRLIIKREPYGPAKLGDIVLFEDKQSSPLWELTAHRIVRIISHNKFITKGDNLLKHDSGIRSSREIVGQAVMLVRKNRLMPLTKGLYGWVGRLMARYSRRNITPGIIMSRVKQLAGLT
ncbi:MAG: S24/S26 family peptidase [Deltaproteobacteria bacterium]|nr:S24/S26 family peptidase [Deltaproteobacteria bacterium]